MLIEELTKARQALINSGFCAAGSHGSGDPEVNALDRAIAAIPQMSSALTGCVSRFGDENAEDDWDAIKAALAAAALAE